jgi:hypothetical protein
MNVRHLEQKGRQTMDKVRRGELLVEKEDIERDIKQARARLVKVGERLTQLGETLKRRPETIGFTKQGNSVRATSTATSFVQVESFDVAIAGDIEKAVQDVVILQDAMDRLGRIDRDLMTMPTT